MESKCHQCRRAGEKLFLKGARCFTPKCAMSRHSTPPGMHGAKRKKKSDYGLQLETGTIRRGSVATTLTLTFTRTSVFTTVTLFVGYN